MSALQEISKKKPLWALVALLLLAEQAWAFKNNQHSDATDRAAQEASSTAADIAKFRTTIRAWSFGIGVIGKPAEQLAHVFDQERGILSVGNNNGPVDEIFPLIDARYLQGNFASEGLDAEGAYVLIGTMIHLIEDQASAPHGANVIHGPGDNFEQLSADFGFTGSQGAVAPSQAYLASLLTTQVRISSWIPPSPMSPYDQYYVFNDQLPGKSGTRYHGEFSFNSNDPTQDGIDPAVTGAYGGEGGDDIFSHTLEPGRYHDQGTQAADFAYNFLARISRTLRPLVSGVTIAGSGAGEPAIVNLISGSPVRFRIAENRASAFDLKVFI